MTLRHRKRQQRSARRSICRKHPDKVLVFRDGEVWCWFCDAPPETVEFAMSETERYLTGDGTQSAAIQSRLREKYGVIEMTTGTALVLREPTAVELKAVGKKFESMVEGFGNDISDADLHLAAQLSNAGFLPQHFNIIHGGLYMNFTGWTFWTKQAFGTMDGGSDARPMTPDERRAYKVEEKEHAFVATYYKIAGGQRFQVSKDFGRAGGLKEQNPLAKTGGLAPEIAQKRALVRAMRQAAPLGVNIGTFDADIGEVVEVVVEAPAIEAPAETEPKESPEPITSVPRELAEVTVAKIEAHGFKKEDIAEFNYLDIKGGAAVMAMLLDGYDADTVADAVKQTLRPKTDTDATYTDKKTGELVEELPW